MKIFSLIFVILSTCLLTSCGFELRSNIDLPPELKKIYVDSATPYGKFEKYLKNILSDSNIDIVDSPDQSHYILRIDMHQVVENNAAVSVNTVTRSYTINYTVQYSLVHNGITVLPNQTVSISQGYLSSSTQLSSASDNQLEGTIESLQHLAADQIMSRLSSQDVRKLLLAKETATVKQAKTKSHETTNQST